MNILHPTHIFVFFESCYCHRKLKKKIKNKKQETSIAYMNTFLNLYQSLFKCKQTKTKSYRCKQINNQVDQTTILKGPEDIDNIYVKVSDEL